MEDLYQGRVLEYAVLEVVELRSLVEGRRAQLDQVDEYLLVRVKSRDLDAAHCYDTSFLFENLLLDELDVDADELLLLLDLSSYLIQVRQVFDVDHLKIFDCCKKMESVEMADLLLHLLDSFVGKLEL